MNKKEPLKLNKKFFKSLSVLLLTMVLFLGGGFATTKYMALPFFMSVSADEDESSGSGDSTDYSFYKLASAAATYFNESQSPDGKGLNNKLQYFTAGGDVLGFSDENKTKGVIGWITSKLSTSSITYSYGSLGDKLKIEGKDGHGFTGLQSYANFGRTLRSLGLDSTATEGGGMSSMVRTVAGGLMSLFYTGGVAVDKIFSLTLEFLKAVNPFRLFTDALSGEISGALYMGGSAPSALKSFSKFIGPIFVRLRNLSLTAIIPVMLGFLVFHLIFKSRDGMAGSRVKTFLKRFIFIVAGVPLLGSIYTGVIDNLASMTSENGFGASNVIMSTFVDFEGWAKKGLDRSGINISWDEKNNEASINSMNNLRNTAIQINGMTYSSANELTKLGGDKPLAATLLQSGDSSKAVEDAYDILKKYSSGSFYHASDFESDFKSELTKGGNKKEIKKFFEKYTDPKNYEKDIKDYRNILLSDSGSKMSALSVYNYLSTKFDSDNMTVFSNDKASSGFVRESHRSVNVIGSGILKFLHFVNALVLLAAYTIIGVGYALSIIFGNLKRTGHLIMAIPASAVGSLQAMGRVIGYTVLMICEIVTVMALYLFVQSVLFGLSGMLSDMFVKAEPTIENVNSYVSGTIILLDGNSSLPNVILVFNIVLMIMIVIFSLKLRRSVVKSAEEMILNFTNSIFKDFRIGGAHQYAGGGNPVDSAVDKAVDKFSNRNNENKNAKEVSPDASPEELGGAASFMQVMGEENSKKDEDRKVGTGDTGFREEDNEIVDAEYREVDDESINETNKSESKSSLHKTQARPIDIYDEEGNVIGQAVNNENKLPTKMYNEYFYGESRSGKKMDDYDTADKDVAKRVLEGDSLAETEDLSYGKSVVKRKDGKLYVDGKDVTPYLKEVKSDGRFDDERDSSRSSLETEGNYNVTVDRNGNKRVKVDSDVNVQGRRTQNINASDEVSGSEINEVRGVGQNTVETRKVRGINGEIYTVDRNNQLRTPNGQIVRDSQGNAITYNDTSRQVDSQNVRGISAGSYQNKGYASYNHDTNQTGQNHQSQKVRGVGGYDSNGYSQGSQNSQDRGYVNQNQGNRGVSVDSSYQSNQYDRYRNNQNQGNNQSQNNRGVRVDTSYQPNQQAQSRGDQQIRGVGAVNYGPTSQNQGGNQSYQTQSNRGVSYDSTSQNAQASQGYQSQSNRGVASSNQGYQNQGASQAYQTQGSRNVSSSDYQARGVSSPNQSKQVVETKTTVSSGQRSNGYAGDGSNVASYASRGVNYNVENRNINNDSFRNTSNSIENSTPRSVGGHSTVINNKANTVLNSNGQSSTSGNAGVTNNMHMSNIYSSQNTNNVQTNNMQTNSSKTSVHNSSSLGNGFNPAAFANRGSNYSSNVTNNTVYNNNSSKVENKNVNNSQSSYNNVSYSKNNGGGFGGNGNTYINNTQNHHNMQNNNTVNNSNTSISNSNSQSSMSQKLINKLGGNKVDSNARYQASGKLYNDTKRPDTPKGKPKVKISE